MEQMGFNVGSLLAGVGVAGLAIGLAAQETLGNIFAGFVLLWDRPFRLGDAVTISGTFGNVTEIGLRSTRLRTLEHREVTMPNRQVIQEQIVNHTRLPQGAHQRTARRRLRGRSRPGARGAARIGGRQPRRGPGAGAAGGGRRAPDSAVQVELRVWIEDPSAERANFFHVLEIAKRALDAAGVEIPFPHRVVHMVGTAPAETVR